MTGDSDDHDAYWMAWLLALCITNGMTALSCAVFMVFVSDSRWIQQQNTEKNVFEAAIQPEFNRTSGMQASHNIQPLPACGKRKVREQVFSFYMAKEEVQGRCKQRRIARPRFVDRLPRRARSFQDNTLAQAPTLLRRVVSCEDVTAAGRLEAMLAMVAPDVVGRSRELRLRDVLRSTASSITGAISAKLREAARNAIDDMLSSIISFLTYGALLFVLRQYSAVAVGVSLDLGAFSIEL